MAGMREVAAVPIMYVYIYVRILLRIRMYTSLKKCMYVCTYVNMCACEMCIIR